MPDVRQVFIGYDSHETVAFHVAAFSIMRRSSVPVSIVGLRLNQLPMTREPEGSTEFTFSRFLVPWLCDFKGQALFLDCDVLCRTDITKIFEGMEDYHAVSVVKHDYIPKHESKFLGNKQTVYPRKNWSSVMVFNNPLCVTLTPNYVNQATGLELHQFRWIPDHMIGGLDKSWNHLVGEYNPNPDAKIVHFTLGTPCFEKYAECEFAREWYEEKSAMLDYDKRGEYSRPERVEA
jgi:lipopolysaccharide biosynthesis glycosyltransferase